MKISFFRIRAYAIIRSFALSLRSIFVLLRTHDRKVATPRKTKEHRAFIPFFNTHNLSSNFMKRQFLQMGEATL